MFGPLSQFGCILRLAMTNPRTGKFWPKILYKIKSDKSHQNICAWLFLDVHLKIVCRWCLATNMAQSYKSRYLDNVGQNRRQISFSPIYFLSYLLTNTEKFSKTQRGDPWRSSMPLSSPDTYRYILSEKPELPCITMWSQSKFSPISMETLFCLLRKNTERSSFKDLIDLKISPFKKAGNPDSNPCRAPLSVPK